MTMIVQSITIKNLHDVVNILNSPYLCDQYKHLVSIVGSGFGNVYGLENFSGDVLRLEFDDFEDFDLYGHITPQEKHIKDIIEFSREVIREPLLIHCMAGQSRSPAAAAIVIAEKTEPGQERFVFDYLINKTKHGAYIRPNRKMIEIADKLLKRNGRLIEEYMKVWFNK